ncbi:MAG TPA: ABC transporter permease [Planctomycetaceae bacterium]|nr:ABC transporter permease [Planctomycetaceae bacterium]
MRIEENQFWGFFEWLIFQYGLLQGIVVAFAVGLLGFIICYLVSMARNGPGEAFYNVTRVVYELLARDLPGTSGRRVYALAKLSFQEAIRRKVLVVMAVFVVVLLFAGWFLDPGANNIAQLYISCVMTGTSYLLILLGLFLSCFSIPNDIKNKTIQTISTKPVRPTEMILGRILGFGGVGTVLLLGMGLLSYQFVTRGIQHSHEVEEFAADGLSGTTSYDAQHEHTFELIEDENEPGVYRGTTNEVKGHVHQVTGRMVDGTMEYEIGPPEGLLAARIPIYGSLQFTDRQGNLTEGGLSVGYESEYQSYIEGASLMSAIWTFDGVRQSRFPFEDKLPIELSLKAFRTFKGDIVTGVQGEIYLQHPTDERIQSERIPFIVKEFAVDYREIDVDLNGTKDGQPQKLNIYDDLTEDGQLKVVVRCRDPGQYFGMAAADLYLKAGESTFGWNMFKGFLGLWMQMMLVICVGVMFSTFLSGPVAMVATAACLVLGFFGGMAFDIASGEIPGGGPIESLIRIPMQTGAMVDLDLGNPVLEKTIRIVDSGIMYTLFSVFQAIPSFEQFNTAEFVAYGYNINGPLVARHLVMAFAYFMLTFTIAYFFLKTREIAAS